MAELSRVRRGVYWAAVAVFAILLIYRWVSTSAGPLAEMPDTPEYAQAFVCRQCEQVFQVTPRERARLMAGSGSVERSAVTSTRKILLPCPACRQVAAVVAGSCARCGQPFLRTDQDGKRHPLCRDCRGERSPRGESASGRQE